MANGSEGGFRMDDRLHPWLIQPGESAEGYYRFTRYRDMGFQRSLPKLAPLLAEEQHEEAWNAAGPDERQRLADMAQRVIERMSAKYRWVDRCRAYDAMMDAERIKARVQAERDAVAEAAERHHQLAKGTQAVAFKWLEKMLKDATFATPRVADMTVAEFLNLQRSGVMAERLVLGMDSRQEADREAAILAGPAAPDQPTASPAELREIARRAAVEAMAAEPKPTPAKPPPEDDDGRAGAGIRDAGAGPAVPVPAPAAGRGGD